VLGSHESGRAHEEARRRGRRAEQRCLTHARDTEVEKLDLPGVGDEEVLGLEIAVDDALFVRRDENVEHLRADGEHVGQRQHAFAQKTRVDRFPLEQLHHEESGPILGDVVVEDHHGAGVIDRVGHVPLAQKPRANALFDGELGVKHLHGGAFLVPMNGRIDGSHAADAYDLLKAPLAIQHHPQSALGTVDDFCREGHRSLRITRCASDDTGRTCDFRRFYRAALSCVTRRGPAAPPAGSVLLGAGLRPRLRGCVMGRKRSSAGIPAHSRAFRWR
jgi:hypothetical protein